MKRLTTSIIPLFVAMRHLKVFTITLVIISISTLLICCSNNDSPVLTERTKRIIDLYIENTDVKGCDICIFNVLSCNGKYTFSIFASELGGGGVLYGNYCGFTMYRNHRIELWGDSGNGYFWKQKQKPMYVPEPAPCEFDPCDWYLTINMSDSTIIEDSCHFTCGIDYPIDTFNIILKQ